MCYSFSADFPELGRDPMAGRTFSLEDHPELLEPVIDGLNFPQVNVLAKTEGKDDYEVTAQHWGFLPGYISNATAAAQMRKGYKDVSGQFVMPNPLLNARGEELLLPRKIFRGAALEKRVLVPANGFYEWMHHYPMGKKGQRLKTHISIPHFIYMREQPVFYLAGISRTWTDQETGEMTDTFSIVTTDANELLSKIHNSKKRMPVILPPALAEEWLMHTNMSEERIRELAVHQQRSEMMDAYTIGKDFKASPAPKTKVAYRELEEDTNGTPLTLF
ncbi:SOS response-associated peptidase [Chitinophaga lutea]|uniref:Abasic site processing protein n=1 Tax=Chitinophaga lutea TaxID=2488634 RepID=A0A3N4PM15_9BACT|nr:SOS response-associated peptidase family protein [Chitinophaga lutea]RPE05931.1 SOS response-associated peptidase [Chitinophaga lutea]